MAQRLGAAALVASWLALVLTMGSAANAKTMNGFSLDKLSIAESEILAGGPPRDGIPALSAPAFDDATEASWLADSDLVLGVSIAGDHRAYPLRILVWHEIVNDTVGGQAIAVTFCPLCGTGMVFNRQTDQGPVEFGVSGLLYQSDVLMYDRQTESLWSQLAMRAVSGEYRDTPLEWLPVEHLSWAAWRAKYPAGKVLSPDTGHKRDYNTNPYASYEQRQAPIFPVTTSRTDLKRMEKVLGVVIDGKAKAWRLSDLSPAARHDRVGETEVKVTYEPSHQWPRVETGDGRLLPAVIVFWFAWQAFYPDTSLALDH